MNIKDLKEVNEYALRDKENLIIDEIRCRRGLQTIDEVEVSKNILNCSAEVLEEYKGYFDIPFKNVRDAIFKSYKSRNVPVVGFVTLVGKDDLNGYYAVGLYNMKAAKTANLSPIEACKRNEGTVIAVMPMRLTLTDDVQKTIFESAFYNYDINVLHAKEVNGIKGLEIESYHNTLNGDFEFDEELWDVVEDSLKEKEKIKLKDCENER